MRSGLVPDSVHSHARFLGSETLVLCAAPAYLAAHGTPLGVSDLAGHRGIFCGRADGGGEWDVAPDGRADEAVALPVACCIDDLESILLAAQSGLGIARLPTCLAHDALQGSSVVQVLPERRSEAIPLQALWPRTRHLSRRARIVIDELVAHMPSVLQTDG